jgi:hypothetical protein
VKEYIDKFLQVMDELTLEEVTTIVRNYKYGPNVNYEVLEKYLVDKLNIEYPEILVRNLEKYRENDKE